MKKRILGLVTGLLICGCAQMRPPAPAPSPGHLSVDAPIPTDTNIPPVVQQTHFLPPPKPTPEGERYTVVVNDVPVRELLFALARDAELNIDINPNIEGKVTLNAIDQTLPQILKRLSRQVDLRYEIDGDVIIISRDTPFFRTYEVGYVNLSREADSRVSVATRVATTGEGAGDGGGGSGGDNTSSTSLRSTSYNRFWETLNKNILAILGEVGANSSRGGDDLESANVIVNAEAGLIAVQATGAQHELLQDFIDRVLVNAKRQVLIEATIIEVSLNDQYQAGVDWNIILDASKSSFSVGSNLLGAVTDGVIDNAISSFTLGYVDPNNNGRAIDITLRLLREFGETRVLSSPRIMVLNNQTAVLKVVEELVYFEIDITEVDAGTNAQARTNIDTDIRTVPVGLVMSVTPQISENNEITLTVRPTISQQVGQALDPNPQLAEAGVTNAVPIIRTREIESVLQLLDGEIGVLGGLMQDAVASGDRSVPGLSKIPFFGDLFFNTRENRSTKTELVIFLRPVVVRTPSIKKDLKSYQQYLSSTGKPVR